VERALIPPRLCGFGRSRLAGIGAPLVATALAIGSVSLAWKDVSHYLRAEGLTELAAFTFLVMSVGARLVAGVFIVARVVANAPAGVDGLFAAGKSVALAAVGAAAFGALFPLSKAGVNAFDPALVLFGISLAAVGVNRRRRLGAFLARAQAGEEPGWSLGPPREAGDARLAPLVREAVGLMCPLVLRARVAPSAPFREAPREVAVARAPLPSGPATVVPAATWVVLGVALAASAAGLVVVGRGRPTKVWRAFAGMGVSDVQVEGKWIFARREGGGDLVQDQGGSVRSTPYPGARELVVSPLRTCARDDGGRVTCDRGWGAAPDPLVAVDAGAIHLVGAYARACAVMQDGTVRCWGEDGDAGAVAELRAVEAIAVGDSGSCALSSDGVVRCWGSFGDKWVGEVRGYWLAQPTPIVGLSQVTSLAVGHGHACAVSDGAVRCWGANAQRQLGVDGDDRTDPGPPVVIGATAVCAGAGHSCALLRDGTVTCWGATTSRRRALAPERVPGLDDVRRIACGSALSCAQTGRGDVLCWGSQSSL
jgi:hypothetical protein